MLLDLILNATLDHLQLIEYVFGYTLIMFPIIWAVIMLPDHPVFQPTSAGVSITPESPVSADIGWSINY